VLRQRLGLPVEPGILQGDAHGGGNGLEELHVVVHKIAVDLVQDLDDAQHPALRDKRNS